MKRVQCEASQIRKGDDVLIGDNSGVPFMWARAIGVNDEDVTLVRPYLSTVGSEALPELIPLVGMERFRIPRIETGRVYTVVRY